MQQNYHPRQEKKISTQEATFSTRRKNSRQRKNEEKNNHHDFSANNFHYKRFASNQNKKKKNHKRKFTPKQNIEKTISPQNLPAIYLRNNTTFQNPAFIRNYDYRMRRRPSISSSPPPILSSNISKPNERSCRILLEKKVHFSL